MLVDPKSKTIPARQATVVSVSRGAPLRLTNIIDSGGSLLPKQLEALRRARAAFGEGEPAVIHGKVGCGKSMIGAWLVRQCAIHRMHGYMWTVAELMSAQKSWFGNKNFEKPESPIEIAIRCKLLVIDELVASAGSLYDHSELIKIIKSRYDGKRPTLILTNIRPDKFEEVLSKHIADRLRDGGAIIELNGASMRGQ